ncbi:MAG: sigma-70 family RNA polymerase sigma factor [Akkermansia sp.]
MNLVPLQDSNDTDIPDEKVLSQYAEHTRKSLIARLENWEDQRTWDEFYRTYWRLIYSVALKSGLREDEAWDVVQETILAIAKQTKKNMYDPAQGSFKLWLWTVTRWRINDQFRKRKKDTAMIMPANQEENAEHPIDKIPDESNHSFDKVWESEWQKNLLKAAIDRVKTKVSPKQFQLFDYYVLREWSATKVCRQMGVTIAQVYLAKHRVGGALKKELDYLMAQSKDPNPQDTKKST